MSFCQTLVFEMFGHKLYGKYSDTAYNFIPVHSRTVAHFQKLMIYSLTETFIHFRWGQSDKKKYPQNSQNSQMALLPFDIYIIL